jgi:hypothetical protein
MVPRWNPFTSWRWVQERLGVEWIQLAPFAEVGRVAPSWDLEKLHSSLKWDVGFGVRALAMGLLLRLDVAGSPEGACVQMMVDHPFQFQVISPAAPGARRPVSRRGRSAPRRAP